MNKTTCMLVLILIILLFSSSLEASDNITSDFNDDNKIATSLYSTNLSLEYGFEKELEIILEDEYNNKLSNKTIELEIINETFILKTNENGSVIWNLNLEPGNYLACFKFNETDNYKSSNGTSNIIVNKGNTLIIANDMTLNKKGEYLEISVTNENNVLIINKELFILINGVKYSRFTDNAGNAKIKINLNPGIYNIAISSKDSKKYYGALKNITLTILDSNEKLNVSLIGYDLVFEYGNDNYFILTLKDNNNRILINKSVSFIINGVNYLRHTNNEGIAKIKINLLPGNYLIEYFFTDEYYNSPLKNNIIHITLSETNLIGTNFTFYYKDGDYFKVQLLNANNKSLAGKNIIITVNGINYPRTTYNDGYAFLKINLAPGTYIIKSEFLGDLTSTNSIIITDLTILKQNTTITSFNLTLNRKEEYLEIILTDGYNKAIVNEEIQIRINGIDYYRYTDFEGIARLKINLNPGNYNISYYYSENEFYKSSTYSNSLLMYSEDIKLDSILELDNFNITIKGNKLKINLKDINNIDIKNETIEIIINGIRYYRLTDAEGNTYLTINLNPDSYDIFYSFNGSKSFNMQKNNGILLVNHSTNLIYSFNITTTLELNSNLLNTIIQAPIARMINITTSDGDYNFWLRLKEAKNYIDVVDIEENILYFISFNNPSKSILRLNPQIEINHQGISLIFHDDYIKITYYGRLDNDLNKFDAVFNCYNVSRVGYENLELYLNNVKKASIEFTTYLYCDETDYIVKSSESNYIVYPEQVPTDLRTDKLNITRTERISYNTINKMLNIDENYWNPEIAYDSIQSYLITNRKITNEDMDYYLKYLKVENNIDKSINDCFLSALTVFWISDKLKEELSDEYNVSWLFSNYNIVLGGINFNGRYITAQTFHSDIDYIGSSENISTFKFLHSLLFSEIEKFALELTGQEAKCGLSDIVTSILNGATFIFTEDDDYQIISLTNSSSQIIFYKDHGLVATKVTQEDNQTAKGAVIFPLGYLYPNFMSLNLNKLESKFNQIYNYLGKSIVNLLSYAKKLDYKVVLNGISTYNAAKNLLSKSPNLLAFMYESSKLMVAIREELDYSNWKYFGVYPVWEGKTFQFVSEKKVTYTDFLGNSYETNDQVHVVIPYKNEWNPIGENELDRESAYLISDYYGRVNLTEEETYKLETESDEYYIKNGHRWITELD